MESYLRLALKIDKVAEWSGRIVSYLAYPLVGGVAYEVVARYVFNAPTEWAFDMTYMLYGSIFMLGAAYTLLHKGHIRTDVFYGRWPPQKQGKIDTLMYIFLFFPGMIFFLWAGWDYAAHSWMTNEKAGNSPWMPIIYPFKTVIPLTAALLLLQGVSELIKSINAWKRGEWK
ncbi:MAG TPA: TRAP transporter small permease subunit [Thermodesulfobacteriota bacterium]|nr:TRAP transporter small permease subunit [Thermodesulfobacteriota bacterium]